MLGTRLTGPGTLVLLGALAATGKALAQPDTFLCALTHTAACQPRGECVVGAPEAVNLPVLLRVDLKEQKVQAQRQGEEPRASAIASILVADNLRVLQGAEFGTGWTMVLDLSTGAATVTAARAQEGFVAFGTCTSALLK
jgi:hypothetical protein